MYSVHLCTENFAEVARAIATEAGSSDHRIVVLPAETNGLSGDDVRMLADRIVREAFEEPV